MNAIEKVDVEITVVLGRAQLPMHQLLKMGRGAVIELNAHQDDEVWVYANGQLIARGEIMIQGVKIAIAITDPVFPDAA
ncbi:MAG: FliM/FliN family flagellar motor switch protein [Pseudomonadota bacterium]